MRISLPNTASQRILAVIIFFIISLVSVTGWGQLTTNAFTGTAACPTQGNTFSAVSNASIAPLSRNTLICNSTGNVFNSTTLPTTVSRDDNSYIEFSITANSGYTLNLTSLSFFRQASNSAPNSLIVSYSTDPAAANFNSTRVDMATSISPTTGTTLTWTFTNPIVTGNGGKVTFRFYPFGTQRADNTGASASSGTFRLDDVSLFGTVNTASATPTITPTPTALTGFTYVAGSGTSASQSFTLSSSNLTAGGGTITITGSTDYEVSTTSATAGFGGTATLSYTGTGTLASNTVWVRLKSGLSINTYNNESIGISGGGATSSVTVSGSVTSASCTNPTISTQPSTTVQTPCLNGTATALSVTASGTSLTYQWYSNTTSSNTGGTLIGTATSSSYTPSTTTTGTLYYYVIVSSGTCTTTSNVSGGVTVTASSTIALSSAAGTDGQTVGQNNAITNITYTIGGGGTNASVTGLPTGVTGSYASGVYTISGTPSVSGTFTYTVTATGGCNNNPQATGTITVTAASLNLTQSGFTSVLTPQYMASGGSTRLPVMFRATVSGLSASTTYRYYVQGATNSTINGASVDFGTTNSGAGNPLLINSGGTTFTNPSSPGLTTTGGYETFTTNTSGVYTGWFGFVNTGNGRFTAGNLVYPAITIGDNAGTTIARKALDVSVTVLAYSTSAGTVNGSFFQSVTSATAKNMAVLFDNTSGTGRPLAITPVESIGITIGSVISGYSTAAGAWNTILPNNNANGVRLIEQLSVTTGSLVGCAATSANGVWGSVSTVNPTNGVTVKVISGNDDPLIAPAITTQPSATAQSTCLNGTAFTPLSITATGGTVTYQWYSNATSSNAGGTLISGATSSSYTLVNTTAGTLYYYVVVTNNSCSTASNPSGSITVNPATTITADPGGATYCQGATATALNVTATGTGTLTYQWYSNTTNSNSGGTSLGSSNGAQTSAYTPVTTTAGTTYYYVIVTGSCGAATSNTAAVTVNASTVITTNPSDATYCQNATVAALAVSATGTGTFTYQWYSNTTNSNTGGTPVSTSSIYTPSAASAGTFYYYVTVTGTCGSATSSVAALTINAAPSATVTANSPYACSGAGGSFIITGTPNSTVFYTLGSSSSSVTLDGSGIATITVGVISGSTTITLTSVSASVTNCPSTPSGPGSTATITAAPLPTAYDVAGGGNYCSGGTGVPVGLSGSESGVSYQLLVNDGTTTTPAGSPVAGTGSTLNFGNQTIVGTYSVQATNTTTNCQRTGGGQTVMVRYNAPPVISSDAAPASQTVCQNSTPADLSVTATGDNLSYQWFSTTTNTNTGGTAVGTSSSYTPSTATSGTLYYHVVVTGTCGTATSSAVSVTVNLQIIPSVTIVASVNPICSGSSVTFTSSISGGGTSPAYQWQVNGVNAPGASAGSTYKISSLNDGDAVTVILTSNATCATTPTATSNVITETVTPKVTPSVAISANPGGTVCAGTSITFTATPTNGGTTPLYQWQVNGANVGTNSTSNAYSSTTLNSGDIVDVIMTTSLSCVTNTTATSNTIAASVSAPSTITLTSAAGTDNQAAIQNTSITNITYAIGGGATGATVSGLPTGVTGTYSGGVETISGTPTATGTFTYTVTAIGGCTSTASGTVTVCSVPAQASRLVFTNVLSNSVTAGWTNGTGTGRIVYINTANSFTNPANSTTALPANPVYSGSGQQAVYNGSSNSVSLSGLDASTTYWFRVYEYNNCSGTYIYNPDTSLIVSGGKTTNPLSIKTAGSPLVQSGFSNVLVPQYTASGNTTRLPVMFRATVTGLKPNTNYRYYIQAATNSTTGGGTVDFGTTNSGAGNALYINTAGTVYKYTANVSVATTSGYDSLTTDASGNYTGWFGFVNTSNARFTAGNIVYPTITLGNSAGTVLYRRALDTSMTVLAFSTSAGAGNGLFLQSVTNGTARNLAALFDNTSGTGRPLYIAPIETIDTAIASVISGYSRASGAWNAIIPNANANGVRLIEQLSVITGNLVGCAATSATGIWPTGSVSTVNPTNGTTAKVISGKDDPLATCPVYPEINVQQSATDYLTGSTFAYGNVNTNTTRDTTFTIQNTGTDTLKISGVTVAGTGFSLVSAAPAIILAGNSATITVRFTVTTATNYTGTLTIANNDNDESSYIITLTGTGVVPLVPVIAVQQNGTGYANGSTYTYSNTLVNTNNDVAFTIQNTGNTTLNITGITIGGTAFSLQGTAPTSVAAGATASFMVRFAPTSNTTYTGSITINSNDLNQSTYVVNLSGTGVRTTITTGTITGSPFCVSALSGASVTVPFTYTSPNFYVGNFRAELSDGTGSFASPVIIGTIASDQSGSQIITATIPAGTIAGTGYRIRVISTAPSITGNDNGTNLIVTNPVTPSVSIAANPGGTICTGSSVTFTATPTNGGATPSYQWQVNGADVSGETNSTFTTSTLANGNTVDVVMTTSATCVTTTTATSNVITETVTAPSTITLTSAAGTDNQSINLGSAITNITYAIGGGGTGATVSGLPAGVTGTYSGGVETISGTPTAGGTFTYTVTATGGCNNNPTATGIIYICAAPTVQASNLIFTNVTTSGMTVGWTNGNGSGRVVYINTSVPFTNPANSTTLLTANTTYSGSGQQVVYNGTGNSVNVAGLIPSTTYYFRVYEYNNCSGTYTYDTVSVATNPLSKTTAAALVTQAGFTSVLTPQYMINNGSSRLPVMFRATVTGLTANTSYRYFVQGAISTDFGTTNPGAGNPLLINSTGTTYTYTSGASITTAGNYETFTTDVSGNYTGWFGFVNTTNARFATGNAVYPCIVIGNTSGTTISRRALDIAITPLAFSTTSAATNGSFFQSKTSATPKNLVALFDNTAGSGRPLSITPVEYIANAGAGLTSRPAGYDSSNGAWNAIIPNVNANGVEFIEQLSVTTGGLVGCAATDADGIWPTGNISTVNPANGSTVKVISGNDDPLASPTVTTQPSTAPQNVCQNSTATPLSATATGGTLTYQWYSNTTASNTGGTAISGATSSTYTPSTTAIGTTYYYVVISNVSCSTTSNVSGAVTVSTVVTPTVSISQSPASTVCTGSSVTFTATSTNGGAMPAYQWQVNGSNAPGASTTSTYTTSTLVNGDKVDVILTSSSSCVTTTTVTSNIDTVMVTAPSTITLTSATGTNNQAAIQHVAITPITYAIGGGGTGASVTGLPTGVTGAYSSGTFAISGTPTVTGTFNYTVTATGGCNNNPTATGTITVCGAPTTQATSITFTNILANSMTVGWTNGSGTGRVVYINTTNSFTNPASSMTVLSANPVYSGSGQQVVYNGTGNSVSVSGLLPSTTYWYRVYEYNNCSGTYVYNTASIISSNPLSKSTTGALLTQTNFKSVLTPKYMPDSAGTVLGVSVPERLAVMYRATVTGLSPNTQYRYYTQAATNSSANGATVDFGVAQSGAGNPLLVNSSGTSYVYSTSPDLKTAQQYDSLTTDASGNYTGWFGFVNTANTRFKAGNAVYPTITVGNIVGTILYRFALDSAITPLSFKATSTDTSGSFFQSKTFGTPKNLAALFDNIVGTGRPLYIAPIEYIASTGAALQYRATGYDSSNGAWNAIIPNNNANGVRLIEQLSVTTGNVIGCPATDADGIWPTGNVSTVNPTNGKTVKVISGNDDPLVSPAITVQPSANAQTVCQGGTITPLSVTATGGTLTYQWYRNITPTNTGGIAIGGATSSTYTPPATTAGTTYYYVIVSNTSTCSATSNVSGAITVSALPDASISTSHSICAGDGSGVVISSVSGGTVYYHTSTNATEQNIVVIANGGALLTDVPAVTTTYTLDSVKSAAGCITFLSAASTVSVNPLPTASVSGSTTICKNGSATITFSGTAGTTVRYTVNGGTPQSIVLSGSGTATLSTGQLTATTTYALVDVTNTTTTCSQSVSGSATITVSPFITWTGLGSDANWNTDANWCSGSVPLSTESVIIPSGTPYDPKLLSGDVTINGLTIDAGATVDLNSNNFTTGAISGGGMIIGSLPSTMTTTATGTVNFDNANNTIHNLIVSAGTLTLGSALNIEAGTSAKPSIVTIANGAQLNTGDNLTLKSDVNGTAAIGPNLSGASYITGKVTVERYTDAAQATAPSVPRRAWRFITAPVAGQSIFDGWQEGGNLATTFGTKITGEKLDPAQAASEGFDYIGGGNHTSIKQYDSAGNAWVPLSTNSTLGTQIPIRSHQAYMLFVRGNRSVGATGASTANVRAKGTLLQGDQAVAIGTGPYTAVGNPYASTIDFGSLHAHNTGAIQDKFYLWNSHASSFGAYVLVDHNGTNGYEATPAPFATSTAQDDDAYKYIPSGSGFFVSPAANPSSTTLTISEGDKAAGSKPPVNAFRVVAATNVRQLLVNLNQKNSDTSADLADGFRVKFSGDYEGNEDDNSSIKAANFNENLGLTRGGSDLIVEARGDVKKTDTLYMKMWYVTKRNYQLQMKADNFTSAPDVHAWLIDSYLSTKQELSLSGSITTVDFAVTSDSLSWKSDRFMIVFRNNAVVLPVTLTSVKASPANGGVNVSWTVTNEVNIKQYTIEKSADGGTTYTAMGTQAAKNNRGAALTSYNGFDAAPKVGDNLYRIRIEAKDGTVTYSSVVKVTIGEDNQRIQITIYPNPVREGKVNLQMTNLKAGTYLVSIYTSGGGQTVYQRKITITLPGTTQSEELRLGNAIAQGSYQVRIADHNGTVIKETQLIVSR